MSISCYLKLSKCIYFLYHILLSDCWMRDYSTKYRYGSPWARQPRNVVNNQSILRCRKRVFIMYVWKFRYYKFWVKACQRNIPSILGRNSVGNARVNKIMSLNVCGIRSKLKVPVIEKMCTTMRYYCAFANQTLISILSMKL